MENIYSIKVRSKKVALEEGFELFEPQRKFISNTLKRNFKEYEKDETNLELAEQALLKTARIEGVELPAAEGKVLVRGGVRTIGVGITAKLANEGRIDLRGRIVKTARDIATISQVFRNPNYETFKYIYVKENKIVAHEGRTSRRPIEFD